MKRVTLIFIILSFSLAIASDDINNTIKASKPSVVSIVVRLDIDKFAIIGTGFFINENGAIATCYHVVRNIKKVEVLRNSDLEKSILIGYSKTEDDLPQLNTPIYKLNDKKLFVLATVMKKDTLNDLAVLWTNYANTSFLKLGSYDAVDEGEELIFLGFPFGLNRLITHKGMVSYKGKLIISDDANNIPVNAFQIDGIVNNGNSGGPLISLKQNKVVGIIKAKHGNIGPYLKSIVEGEIKTEGIGFGLIDFGVFSREVTNALDRNIQMGIGYAISTDNLKLLIK